jgi:hypothetical protein
VLESESEVAGPHGLLDFGNAPFTGNHTLLHREKGGKFLHTSTKDSYQCAELRQGQPGIGAEGSWHLAADRIEGPVGQRACAN